MVIADTATAHDRTFIIEVMAMNMVTEMVTPATQTSDCRRWARR